MPRPLLLTPDAPDGVSLPGLVSASARLNVLGDVKSTLRSIGLSPAKPGCISTNVVGRERELAARLGCAPSIVFAATTPVLDADDATILRWGDGAIRSTNLETHLRRVSPVSLATSPHHRAAWCNRLLDHCPESLELLVDRCARCGRPQRWLAARGIGFCDEPGCGSIIGSGSMLPSEFAEGYRLFAAICSPIPAQRRDAMTRLAPRLSSLPPVTLTELAFKIGLALEGAPTADRRARADLSPLARSRAASRGALALLDWPLRIRREIRAELARRGLGDGAARRELRAGMLAAGRSIRGGAELLDVISQALPEIHVEVGRSFAGMGGERLLGSAAALRLGISHVELRRLASSGMFTEEGVVDGSYRRALYDADQVERAEAAWRGSAPIEHLMRRTGLPRYACERIAGAGDVGRESHPFAIHLPGQPRLRRDALDGYLSDLRFACRSGQVPTDCIRLNAAMRIVGGRLKPWRQVLQAIMHQRLAVWYVAGPGPLIARLFARPADVAVFAALDADEALSPSTYVSTKLSQIDAMGVLNLRQIDGPRLAEAGLLHFDAGSRSLLVAVDEVLALARAHVATAEAAARFRQVPNAAWHRVVRSLGPPSSPAGWSRPAFDQSFGRL